LWEYDDNIVGCSILDESVTRECPVRVTLNDLTATMEMHMDLTRLGFASVRVIDIAISCEAVKV
jgi:hypothetical protein